LDVIDDYLAKQGKEHPEGLDHAKAELLKAKAHADRCEREFQRSLEKLDQARTKFDRKVKLLRTLIGDEDPDRPSPPAPAVEATPLPPAAPTDELAEGLVSCKNPDCRADIPPPGGFCGKCREKFATMAEGTAPPFSEVYTKPDPGLSDAGDGLS